MLILAVGGPINGKVLQIAQGTQTLVVPVMNHDRAPKQMQRRVWFYDCRYRKTRIIRDGKTVYRFFDGYYLPQR